MMTTNSRRVGRSWSAAMAAAILMVVTAHPGTAADRAWLGIALGGRSDADGATVARVFPGSPADEAGVRQGDRITAVNGVPVSGSSDLQQRIAALRPGVPVALDVDRSGRPVRVRAALGAAPEEIARRLPTRPTSSEAADLVRRMERSQRATVLRIRDALSAATDRERVEWLRISLDDAKEQLALIERLAAIVDPAPPAPTSASTRFDPRQLVVTGGVEVGDRIKVVLRDPESGREHLVGAGDRVRGYTVVSVNRLDAGLLEIVLESADDRVVLVETGL